MEAMSQTRAFLILIGLPEFQDFLPNDARQRITAIIRPSSVTAVEIARYIREANRRATGTANLHPFTMNAVDYLAEIAGGNIRRTVRLCYHSYLAATATGSNVTRAMLREIAREQFESTRTEDIDAELSRAIEARGWLVEKNKTFESDKSKQQVDFWLPVGEEGAGIALWITRSILQEQEVQALAQRAAAVTQKDDTGIKVNTVLVVNGHLADNLQSELEKAFGRVIIYQPRGFRAELDAVLTGMRVRLEQRDRDNVLIAIKQRVDEITRQNRSIDSQLSEFSRRSFDRTDLQAAVSVGLRTFFGQLTSNTVSSEENYPRIAALFDTAIQTIDQIFVMDDILDLIFGMPKDLTLIPEKERFLYLRRRYRSLHPRLLADSSLALLYILKSSCLAFRRGIFFCLANEVTMMAEPFVDMDGQIAAMCQSFDRFVEDIHLTSTIEEMFERRLRVLDELGVDRRNYGRLSPDSVERITRVIRNLPREVFEATRSIQRKYSDLR
jgi:hypothetical protein